MFVSGNLCDGVALQNGRTQAHQCFVLTLIEGGVVNPLQLDANGVVIAVAASPVT